MKIAKLALIMVLIGMTALGAEVRAAEEDSAETTIVSENTEAEADDAAELSEHIFTIVTNPAEDCSIAMNINFHTDLGFENCFVEYTTADDLLWEKASKQEGSFTAYEHSVSANPFYYAAEGREFERKVFLDYNVTLSDLTPETHYMYRIFDGERWSKTSYFKTAGSPEWSFVVTGDIHEYKKGYLPRRAEIAETAINAAVSLAEQMEAPEVEHIVSVGDIVASGRPYVQWQQLYEREFIRNYSFANAIGNHDAEPPSGYRSNKYSNICSNYPLNGHEGQLGTSFYYIYNNVIFLYLTYWDDAAAAQQWARDVLNSMAGKYRYSVLLNHYSAMNKYAGGGFTEFWTDWSPFCDEMKIDLVLSGDHHVYMRSHPLRNGEIAEDYGAENPDATVYITADSSDGDRGSLKEEVAVYWKNHVAAKYYRYMYGGTSHDITSMLVEVRDDRLTVRFVYYEDKRPAEKSSDFCEGTVQGQEYFFYGDTSYVYPSEH